MSGRRGDPLIAHAARRALESPGAIAGEPLEADEIAAFEASHGRLPTDFVAMITELGQAAEIAAMRVRCLDDEAVDMFWRYTAPPELERARYLLLGDDYSGEYYALDLRQGPPHPVVFLESWRLEDGNPPPEVAPSLLAFLRCDGDGQ